MKLTFSETPKTGFPAMRPICFPGEMIIGELKNVVWSSPLLHIFICTPEYFTMKQTL